MHNSVINSLKLFPEKLRKTITYDNGTENANHKLTDKVLKTKAYFCNPYHSWEKGSIENRIGMIRKYFPKKTDWSLITQKQLNRIVKKINSRPMKCLCFKTPEQVFYRTSSLNVAISYIQTAIYLINNMSNILLMCFYNLYRFCLYFV